MRKNKLLTAVIGLLLTAVLLAASISAVFAVETAAARLSFSVRNVPGTVVLEALDGSPSPDQSIYENVSDGTFSLHFSEADTYHYKIYQRPGATAGVQYDSTVYEITVTVLFDGDGGLSAAISVNREGDSHKLTANDVVFENICAESGIRLHKTVTGAGDKSKEWHFTVTLGEPLTGIYGDIAFQDGVGHVVLRDGESAVADGFFPGIFYRVTEEEANQDGYKTTSDGAEGTMINGTILPVSFENHKSLITELIHPPKTDDPSQIGIWAAVCAFSLTCAMCLFFMRKNGKRNG